MISSTRPPRHFGAPIAVLAALALLLGAAPAGADTVGSGEASAFGATITVAGQEVIPPTPLAEATLESDDVSETVVDIPAEPLAVSGTLNADAAVHAESDIDSALTVVSQEFAGPYNASGVALIEGADVLLDTVADDVSLVTADVIRAEAVAVCRDGAVEYSASSEIINLNIGGEDVPLNEPLEQVIDGLNDVLDQTGLNQVVDIERNVVTPTADGIAVDALVVTVLAAAGDEPGAQVRLGHAEVDAAACGGALPECSDSVDNDGDDLVDFPADPGCDSAEDDSEIDEVVTAAPDAPTPQPAQPSLPRTGADASTMAGVAGAMALGALTLAFLRRRTLT